MLNRFSTTAFALPESVTHGTKSLADSLNSERRRRQVLDLGIGTLDLPTDPRIADAIGEAAHRNRRQLHEFSPVRGYGFLREAISARVARLHGLQADPLREVLVTPGGIKGALTVIFHTFLEPGDEVLVPVPNWPHYVDMIRLHGGVARPILPSGGVRLGLTARDLERHLDDSSRLLVLGDCVNPTGKVYSGEEIEEIARVVARHNLDCSAVGLPGVDVVLDCPYEAHVRLPRPPLFAGIDIALASGRQRMGDRTVYVSGPGKTYGMHGDRLGYLIAPPEVVDVASRVQANTNSFASSYAQIACHRALQEDMDEVAEERARLARQSLEATFGRLAAIEGIDLEAPDGAYFLFVDFSHHSEHYVSRGYESAASFLLGEADIATVDGSRFVEGVPGFEHWVRINCGRSPEILEEACARIEQVLEGALR
ncbi:MAG TPA: aminotransferase class I/II-fold pyridoxal phosphate-dependent enzyme [Solirubrobacterales bacterium]|nr:aminotransferase class I/II-fold pyridoxal phosphate-dependent enzyme [Solirubrobacterales bacterium]